MSIYRFLSAACVGALLAIGAAPIPGQAQLPFDPAAIGDLSPEQRQRALAALGGDSAAAGVNASADGRFRDPRLVEPAAAASTVVVVDPPAAPLQPARTVVDLADADDPPQALKPFGYELFSNAATTFAPATDIPVPADYVVGPGDAIRVQLFGNDNGNYSLLVGRDGQINFPKLGPITVAGLDFDTVRAAIVERVGRELIGVQASVSLGELRSMRVFLLGDVRQPGSYTVSSLATMTHLLFAGGGITEVGSMREVQLKRSGRLVQQLDLYDLLLDGDSSADARLQPGDVVFVPPVGARVTVSGAVKRPAIYELNEERSVADALDLAGGLLASVNTGTVRLERFESNRRNILQLDLSRRADLQAGVRDGDVLRIGGIAEAVDDQVQIFGHVRYPGPYQWKPGDTLQALLKLASLKPSDANAELYLPLALIERTDPETRVRRWSSVNVSSVTADGAAPVALAQGDRVIVLTRADVEYLGSREVRAVINGSRAVAATCPALATLAELANTERASRFLKAVNAEEVREGQAQAADDARCPATFRKAPRALAYLLEESAAVYGEVRRPGFYPIAAGTSLQSLIATAGGLSHEADAANVEFVSYDEALASGQSRYRTLDLDADRTLDLAVRPGDVFNIKPRYLGQEVGTVRLLGEVRFPGRYGILRGERLSQVIRRAGGTTADAFPYGAVFTRETARRAEADSYRRAAQDLQEAMATAVTSGALGRDSGNSTQFLSAVVARLKEAEPVGRVVIEADPVVLDARPELDPIVEPGDLLVMPKRPISVTVIGQVLNPGSLAFDPGAGPRDYIQRAGGFAQAADEGRTFLILPNGTARTLSTSFWNYRADDIPPGSIIVVPRDAAPFNLVAFSERVFGLLSNLAITAAALATISRN